MLEKLKQLRKEAGMSQKELAERIGVSQQSVNKYENHDVEPDIQTMIRIADCFFTSVDYLIGHSEERRFLPFSDTAELSDEEIVLLYKYRRLSPLQKRCVKTVVDSYNETE